MRRIIVVFVREYHFDLGMNCDYGLAKAKIGMAYFMKGRVSAPQAVFFFEAEQSSFYRKHIKFLGTTHGHTGDTSFDKREAPGGKQPPAKNSRAS